MRTLPTEFKKNDLKYRIIDRTDTRYLAEVIAESGVIGYETERIPGNNEFGKASKFKGRSTEVFMPPRMFAEAKEAFRLGQQSDFERLGKQELHRVVLLYSQDEF